MLSVHTLSPWLPVPGTAAVCAVSGGMDSMCLLHVLWRWCAGNGVPLTAAHFHHGLRETADRDEAFVRDWCAIKGVSFTAGQGDARAYAAENGLSVEEAARNLRYAFLRETAAQCAPHGGPPVSIYTAHHAGDNAETVLLNLIRGTGIRGLAGMRRRREGIVRPFLDVSRAELEEYAAAHGIPHVEDETNADPSAAARNRVRLELLPLLRELNPRVEEHICRAASQLSEIDDDLEAEARRRMASVEIRDGRAVFPCAVLMDAPPCVRPRMLLSALDGMGVGRKDFGAVHLDAVLSLLGEDGKHGEQPERNEKRKHGEQPERNCDGRERHLDVPHGVTARYARGILTMERLSPVRFPLTEAEAELIPGKPVQWGQYRVTLLPKGGDSQGNYTDSRTNYTDSRANYTDCQGNSFVLRDGPERLTISRVRAGDRLFLPGSSGSRTVKRLCLDRRISQEERDGLPAVYADGRLAAVWRLGTDVSFLPEEGEGMAGMDDLAETADFPARSTEGVRRILVEGAEKKF